VLVVSAVEEDVADEVCVAAVLVAVTRAVCATVVEVTGVGSGSASVDVVVTVADGWVSTAAAPALPAAAEPAVPALELSDVGEDDRELVLPPDDDTLLLLRAEWAVVFLAVLDESVADESLEPGELLSELADALLALPPEDPVSA
jgi:hypothetical protein